MKKTLLAMGAAATVAGASFFYPTSSAQAGCFGCWVGAGVATGLVAGTIIGSAAAAPSYYGPPPVYYGPGCYWTRERFWTGWGWAWRRIRVCG